MILCYIEADSDTQNYYNSYQADFDKKDSALRFAADNLVGCNGVGSANDNDFHGHNNSPDCLDEAGLEVFGAVHGPFDV